LTSAVIQVLLPPPGPYGPIGKNRFRWGENVGGYGWHASVLGGWKKEFLDILSENCLFNLPVRGWFTLQEGSLCAKAAMAPRKFFCAAFWNRSGTAPMFGNLLKTRGSWTTRWLRFHFTEEFLDIFSGNCPCESAGMLICALSTMLQGGLSADLVATSTIMRETNPQAAPMADIFFQ
jgi:hypothetical protein